jgi:hypothetical protein
MGRGIEEGIWVIEFIDTYSGMEIFLEGTGEYYMGFKN